VAVFPSSSHKWAIIRQANGSIYIITSPLSLFNPLCFCLGDFKSCFCRFLDLNLLEKTCVFYFIMKIKMNVNNFAGGRKLVKGNTCKNTFRARHLRFIDADVIYIYRESRARIFKLLRSPRIDSKESIPPVYV